MANLVQTPSEPPAGTSTPTNGAGATLTGTDLEHLIFWASGAAVLLLLTDWYPKAGIALTGLIVAGVLLRFSGNVSSWVSGVTATSTTQPVAGGVNNSGTGPASRVVALPVNSFLRSAIRKGA